NHDGDQHAYMGGTGTWIEQALKVDHAAPVLWTAGAIFEVSAEIGRPGWRTAVNDAVRFYIGQIDGEGNRTVLAAQLFNIDHLTPVTNGRGGWDDVTALFDSSLFAVAPTVGQEIYIGFSAAKDGPNAQTSSVVMDNVRV